MNILNALLKYRSIPLYLLFIVYLLVVQPILLGELRQLAENDQPSLLFGILILTIQFLELLAFYLKRPMMMDYIGSNLNSKQSPVQASILIIVFVPILHIGMAAFLYIAAAQIGGFQPADSDGFWPQMAFVLGMFIVLAKEGLMLEQWWLKPVGSEHQAASNSSNQFSLSKRLLDFSGDILLLMFTAVGYTALWSYFAIGSPLESGSVWWMAVQYFGVLLFFIMTIVPLRGVYYMFLPFLKLNKRQIVLEWAGLLVSFIVAAMSIPVG